MNKLEGLPQNINKNNIESAEDTDYRDEQAEKLNDLRRTEGKLAAIEYLDVLRSDPQYQEARRDHKNTLAQASNETVAEDMMSKIEIKAAIITRSLNLGLANLLANGESSGIHRNQDDLYETKDDLNTVEFMQTVGEEVAALENNGTDKETVLSSLTDRVALLTDELKPLCDKYNSENRKNFWDHKYTEDIASVVSSWFDGIRKMMTNRSMEDAYSEIMSKESERALIQWILQNVEESDADFNVSIIIDRMKIKQKQLIEADIKDWKN